MAPTQAGTLQHRIESGNGIAAWSALAWDTDQFGMAAARLDGSGSSGILPRIASAKTQLLRDVLAECREAGIRHLSARVDTGDFTTIHALEEAGFELIDGIQTFRLSLKGIIATPPPGTRLFEPKTCRKFSKSQDCFHLRPLSCRPVASAGVGDQVNESWTRNCCLGTAADAVVVAEEEGRVASFVTCRRIEKQAMGSSFWSRPPNGPAGGGPPAARVWPLSTGSRSEGAKPSRSERSFEISPLPAFTKASDSG